MAKLDPAWLGPVRRVIEQLASSRVREFEMAQRSFRLRLRRRAPTASAQDPSASPRHRRARGTPAAQPAPAATRRAPVQQAGDVQISAPFTGIFYRAPSPTAGPYVSEGEWVEAGTTIGLIEAMKIFNEVKTEQGGRIDRLLVLSGQLVQAGEPLATLTPGKPTETTL